MNLFPVGFWVENPMVFTGIWEQRGWKWCLKAKPKSLPGQMANCVVPFICPMQITSRSNITTGSRVPVCFAKPVLRFCCILYGVQVRLPAAGGSVVPGAASPCPWGWGQLGLRWGWATNTAVVCRIQPPCSWGQACQDAINSCIPFSQPQICAVLVGLPPPATLLRSVLRAGGHFLGCPTSRSALIEA